MAERKNVKKENVVSIVRAENFDGTANKIVAEKYSKDVKKEIDGKNLTVDFKKSKKGTKNSKENTKNSKKNITEKNNKKDEEPMKLLVVSVAQGYATDVVETARAAGADGAFFIEGRGLGKSEKKFFGLNIEPETEIVFMAVPERICVDVSKAIYAKCRFTDNSRCCVFVLPIAAAYV